MVKSPCYRYFAVEINHKIHDSWRSSNFQPRFPARSHAVGSGGLDWLDLFFEVPVWCGDAIHTKGSEEMTVIE